MPLLDDYEEVKINTAAQKEPKKRTRKPAVKAVDPPNVLAAPVVVAPVAPSVAPAPVVVASSAVPVTPVAPAPVVVAVAPVAPPVASAKPPKPVPKLFGKVMQTGHRIEPKPSQPDPRMSLKFPVKSGRSGPKF